MTGGTATDAATRFKSGAKVTSTADLRDGDEVVAPMVGTVRRRNNSWYIEDGQLGPTGLMMAIDRGKVRWQHRVTCYEPGGVYRSPDTGRTWEYLPNLAPSPAAPFRELGSNVWCMPIAAVLVPCDVVPREATA